MIEAYVPHRSDPTDCTAPMRPAEKLTRAPAMENLVETRKKQYEIIQQLGVMFSSLSGEPVSDEAAQEWRGLVELTEQIADANDTIARLVKDCRELIGT